MSVRTSIAAVLIGVVALSAATASRADTINLTTSYVSFDPADDFNTFTMTFLLPTGFTNATLNITTFSADDRAALVLNGSHVAATGIFGPAPGADPIVGSMVLTAGGSNDPYVFQYGNVGPFQPITGAFIEGLNTALIILNDTGNGIFGNLNPNSFPTSLSFAATVTFDAPAAVPLPAALPLFASALGLGGFFGWRQRKRAIA